MEQVGEVGGREAPHVWSPTAVLVAAWALLVVVVVIVVVVVLLQGAMRGAW